MYLWRVAVVHWRLVVWVVVSTIRGGMVVVRRIVVVGIDVVRVVTLRGVGDYAVGAVVGAIDGIAVGAVDGASGTVDVVDVVPADHSGCSGHSPAD